ncbi:hypothetical protein NLL49_04825 [Corynebacterium propinquum]|uniref:hypothetical protein n=1 Tax=Corynebacterium propinquum TaxID=43769 RepID=UPI00266F79C3|nr:hypothetical protein [Corynebacterium propinquum]WKS28547.1 hypothetical protein NLL49_04825 [Corynebacterium propinquum]
MSIPEQAPTPKIDPTSANREQQILTLRFTGRNNSNNLHELRAEHISDVLEGISELTQDFDKAGAFHNSGPSRRDLFVRPAREGSFIIELVQVIVDSPLAQAAAENPAEAAAALGLPSVSQITWIAIRMFKDQVKDFNHLENGNVKINWKDDTASEVTPAVWEELNKRMRRRKKQLRKIMRPMEDARVAELEVSSTADRSEKTTITLVKDDYEAIAPDDSEKEEFDIFETKGQLSAIDFDDSDRWKIKTSFATRVATVEDENFLNKVASGLYLNSTDSFDLKIREDRVTKNGRTTRKWTILRIQKEGELNDDDESASDI